MIAKIFSVEIDGIEGFDEMGFMLFRLMLVDEWPIDDMMEESKVMTYILVGSYLAIVAILFINLYIALLSDTFQRIYDNAQANAAMQRAHFCFDSWHGLDGDDLFELLDFFNSPQCNPYSVSWDDDGADSGQTDLQKVTHQIYEKVENLDDFVRKEHEL